MDEQEQAHDAQQAVAQAVSAQFPCPSWCDQEHSWQPGDDTHWVTHTRQFAWSSGLSVEVWQVVSIADGARTDQPAVVNLEVTPGRALSVESARTLAYDLSVSLNGAIDLAANINDRNLDDQH